jgi:uncharacterized membrane protein YoaK (UPF0700 family)
MRSTHTFITDTRVAARGVALVLLAVAAGCVDAISYLGLDGVFTAAMTGNTVVLGLAAGQGELATVSRAGAALAGFVTGAMLGAVIVERRPLEAIWPPAVTAALATEVLLLGILAAVWQLANPVPPDVWLYLLIVLAGIAMGVQSAAIAHLDVSGISTTYVTGTLTSFASRLMGRLYPIRHPPAAGEARPPVERRPGLHLSVWLAYGVGAALAGLCRTRWTEPLRLAQTGMALHWPVLALLLALLIVAVVVIAASLADLVGRFRRRTAMKSQANMD